MDQRQGSPHRDAPEAVPDQPRTTFGFVGSDAYEYYEPPATTTSEHNRSSVPEYQQYDQNESSLRLSTQSPPIPGSDRTRSPQLSDGGFTRSRPLSPMAYYSEIHSPDPETVYNGQEKEAVHTPQLQSKVPSYHAHAFPGLNHQNSGENPQVWSDSDPQRVDENKKKPVYKRWPFIIIVVLLIILIAVGVALGVVFGTKKSHDQSGSGSSTSTPTPSASPTASVPGDNPNVDINTSIGGQINNAYYSKSGAWNGSGIAIAGVDQTLNQAIYAFYQDSTGLLQFTFMDAQKRWSRVGPVNDGSYPALNATPLSTVQHLVGDELIWHVFYIDVNYIIRERYITNSSTSSPTPIWQDGPLSDKNLAVWQSNTIGLQACYWGNYYGINSQNGTQSTAGIHLWYASGATTFQQYSWTNGTSEWVFDKTWNDLSGNGGVGCQTWLQGPTEYVWFVDTHNSLAMYWIDNNRSASATPDHPINVWTPVDIQVSGVQIDSSLGYTNFMMYQAEDTTVRGANVTWAAENTTIADGRGDGGKDTFTLQLGGEDVHAVRGSHLSITAVKDVGGGSSLLIFLQEEGNDVSMYTRDALNSGALWQAAGQNPVEPSN